MKKIKIDFFWISAILFFLSITLVVLTQEILFGILVVVGIIVFITTSDYSLVLIPRRKR